MSGAVQFTAMPQLAALLAQQALEVAQQLLPNGKREGDEWCVGNINGDPGQSLRIRLSGSKAGVWKDFANPEHRGDLVELWSLVRGLGKAEAAREIREYLQLSTPITGRTAPARQKQSTPTALPGPAKSINQEYHRNLVARLEANSEAMQWLMGETRGLSAETITRFGLGLSAPYKRKNGPVTANAVVAPMRSRVTGEFLNKSAYITVPGVTEHPIDDNGWMKGAPQCYYATPVQNRRIIFVCEGLKDVWQHYQGLVEAGLQDQILLASSTHGSAFPAEWKHESFWSEWQEVYLGHDNDPAGERIAEALVAHIGREAKRIRVPAELGKDWTDFWLNGGTVAGFRSLLDDAPTASGAALEDAAAVPAAAPLLPQVGRFSYRPVDINGAYVNGHLYYPTKTLVVKRDEETGMMVERLETIVVRSDRTTHRAVQAPAPPGTPLHERVMKLTDGTRIERVPQVSSVSSWDYTSISKWISGRFSPRPIGAIVSDVVEILRQAIWLPREEDYYVLALAAPVTYLQKVFESVPLLLLNGPAGSGKSQTGNVMARLCANGVVIGQVSAASAARLIDETRGFVVLDDVEAIAAKAGKDIQISDFVQALKVSYNQHTAKKVWTDVKTMKTETLDFFGVKLLNNTLGADAILGSRMLRIQTRRMPEGLDSQVRDFTVEDLQRIEALRNELHCWAFEYVREVDLAYRQVYKRKTGRSDEIAAPLRTICQMTGDAQLSAHLEAALARQDKEQKALDDDPVETLKEAVRNLIEQGYETVTLTHLSLEMRSLLDADFGKNLSNEVPEWSRPEWIGRQLRSNDLVAPVDKGRKRVFGKNLRLVQFSEWILSKFTGEARPAPKSADDFCAGCPACPYRNAGCELMELRAREEARKQKSRS